MSFTIINSDCLKAMTDMPDGCVDAIVTDPPYGLSFMGKEWDSFGTDTRQPGDEHYLVPDNPYGRSGVRYGWNQDKSKLAKSNRAYQKRMAQIFEEALRVAKPGAHMLCFGGTRTFHRLACSLEDAGWEIRDTIMWVYGCLDEETEILIDGEFVPYNKAKVGSIALGYDIERGTFSWQRIEDTYLYDYDDTAYAIQSDSTDQLVSRNHRCLVERGGVEQFAFAEHIALEREASIPVLEGLHGLLDRLPLPDERAGDAKQNVLEEMRASRQSRPTGQQTREPDVVPVECGAQDLRELWGAKSTLARVTPVHYKGKMWCVKVATGAFVARRHGKIFITGNSGFPKSMDVGKKLPEWQGWGTCLKPAWEPIIVARKPLDGTVAHNVLTHCTGAINIDGCRLETYSGGPHSTPKSNFGGRRNSMSGPMDRTGYDGSKGRFPANLVHDGSQEVLNLFPDTNPSRKGRPRSGRSGTGWGMTHTGSEYDDAGSAARFFYCAKASKKDRGEGNDHPTVKPNALMKWLVRLVCPQGGTVLDPFMGSGSTGVACMQEGIEFVGIDMDAHYCEIAQRRIGAVTNVMFDEV